MMHRKKLVGAVALFFIAWLFWGAGFKQVVAPTDTLKNDVMVNKVVYFEDSEGYLVEPARPGDYAGVVLIHENRGLRPEIVEAAETLAREGYRVLAVDLFKGRVMETQDEARAYSAEYVPEEGLENLAAAVVYLRQAGSSRVASLGWCFGGAESLALSMSDTPLDATVIYYGRLTDDLNKLARIQGPVLGIFGADDVVVPVDSVNAFETQLRELSIESEIYVYPEVGHAFANPSNPNFAPEPTADAWQKTLSFLQTNLR
jgi:carboxymethylenebutenolidase